MTRRTTQWTVGSVLVLVGMLIGIGGTIAATSNDYGLLKGRVSGLEKGQDLNRMAIREVKDDLGARMTRIEGKLDAVLGLRGYGSSAAASK